MNQVRGLRSIAFGALLIIGAAASSGVEDGRTSRDALHLLKSGTADPVTYGVYQVEGRPDEYCDLVVILRNSGSKFIDGAERAGKYLQLRDAKGRDMKMVVKSFPGGLSYQEIGVAHIFVVDSKAPTPWRMTYDYREEAISKLNFEIGDIRPIETVKRKVNLPLGPEGR